MIHQDFSAIEKYEIILCSKETIAAIYTIRKSGESSEEYEKRIFELISFQVKEIAF